nr:MAG TPA: hypothetical protein [Bacteriophage sp.]
MYRARLGQSRFFRRLPDHHKREEQDKQDNQAGVTSILRSPCGSCLSLPVVLH